MNEPLPMSSGPETEYWSGNEENDMLSMDLTTHALVPNPGVNGPLLTTFRPDYYAVPRSYHTNDYPLLSSVPSVNRPSRPPSPQATPPLVPETAHHLPAQRRICRALSRQVFKRCRRGPKHKAPIAFLSTDVSKFRDMVQQLTGITSSASKSCSVSDNSSIGMDNTSRSSMVPVFRPHPTRPLCNGPIHLASLVDTSKSLLRPRPYNIADYPPAFAFHDPPSRSLFQPNLDQGFRGTIDQDIGAMNQHDRLNGSISRHFNHRMNQSFGPLAPSTSLLEIRNPIVDNSAQETNPMSTEDLQRMIDELFAT